MYYLHIWHFCSKASQKKIENIQYRSLTLLPNDYGSDHQLLLEKAENSTMDIKRLRPLALEISKTLNNLIPDFMKKIFHISPH